MDDCESLKAELTRLKSRSSKKDLRMENERLKEKLEVAKDSIEALKMQKISMEKEMDNIRRALEDSREENRNLKRARVDTEAKSDSLKRELKFIRVAFRMGGLRYSCRALDRQDTGTVPVAAFRSIVLKSSVNLSDEEMETIIRKAMVHGDGQFINYEAFFNALTDS